MLLDTPFETTSLPDFFLPAPADSDLEHRIKAILASQHRYALRLLDVEARDGEVALRGFLTTFHEKQLAAQLVLRVAGVIRLIDEIVVPSTTPQETAEATTPNRQNSSRHSTERNSFSRQTV